MSNPITLHIRGAERKRFAINGDSDNIIELNTSDTGILERLEQSYRELLADGNRALEIKSKDLEIDSEESKAFFAELDEIDKKLSKTLDFIFDAEVAKACAAGGKMYDPVDGFFRFEVILSDLMNVLQGDLQAEFEKVIKRREEHTKKYAKK